MLNEDEFSFEIKVAVIGPVSSGKSTLINALLLGKYSEVSIRRTTAGVNFFRLNEATPTTVGSSEVAAVTPNVRFEREDEILQQISQDNQDLRSSEEVIERTFDIEGVEVCSCRNNTKVVVVDIPGINEADSSSKYRNYVLKNWYNFDMVLMTMDARHGVNSEEQVELLEFVSSNLKTEKNIPVIILFNKIDELDFNEEKTILDEARSKISSIFSIPEDKNLAGDITEGKLSGLADLKNADGTYMPIFLPISIRNGYVYRLASEIDEARFCLLEKGLLESIGKEQLGLRQWTKLSEERKYKEAYNAISDPDICAEGLKSSNFAAFSKLLTFCIGGDETQSQLIAAQIESATARLQPTPALADIVESIWKKRRATGEAGLAALPGDLEQSFWTNFDILHDQSISHEKAPVVLNVLESYYDLMVRTSGKEKASEVTEKAVSFVNMVYCNEMAIWKKDLLGFDRLTQVEEALIMTGNKHFMTRFGKLKMILEVERQRAIFDLIATQTQRYVDGYRYLVNETTKVDHTWSFENGDWLVSGKGLPEMSTDPSVSIHYGHTFWLFCQWMEKIEA